MNETPEKSYTYEQCVKSSGVCIATVSNTVRQHLEKTVWHLKTATAMIKLSSLYSTIYPANE